MIQLITIIGASLLVYTIYRKIRWRYKRRRWL